MRSKGQNALAMAEREGLWLPEGTLIVGTHPRMLEVFAKVKRLARRNVTVLISGETGTGKELVARALHELSERRRGPMVAVNSAALPENLIENELFGHQPGSFTGASRSHPGLVESASGGTLFLDEVASMPLPLQSRLLRVLEQRAVRRLGESRERAVDIRVLAATNQPLQELVRQGRFRQDLFHRLHVVQIDIPPLRDRSSDVVSLAEHCLSRLHRRTGEAKQLSRQAAHCLSNYPFPGNVRELQNLIESAFYLCDGSVILPAHLDERLGLQVVPPADEQVDDLYRRLCRGRAEFWRDVRDVFLARDLCRKQVRRLVSRGLEEVGGNYRQLLRLFHLPQSDYHRFLAFLNHHGCKVDFRRYRPHGVLGGAGEDR